ncbi:hypothetical protein G5714_002849 [Onychostoma macrolepis]|uniref:Uncharacterized protein n=1 Tax=Onychostoma macrolepis TaxID=369639 RepID=A0A7J6D7X2_9TELE|nr:hypothetical protein G5714_002849 [Onychostoma macrolepis]
MTKREKEREENCQSHPGNSRVTVRNETAATPNSDDLNGVTLQHSDQSLCILAVILIVILIILDLFLVVEKKIRDPEPGVQMQLRSDESDSLNQSVLRSSE